MLAVLGSAEPAGCQHPAKGTLECSAATKAAQLSLGGLGVPLGQHAAQEPAGRNSLEWWSPLGLW